MARAASVEQALVVEQHEPGLSLSLSLYIYILYTYGLKA